MFNKFTSEIKSLFSIISICLVMTFASSSMEAQRSEQDLSTARAGVILLKQYPEGDWAMLLGEKAGTTQEWKSVNFPAGQYDSKDNRDLQNTALREMKEETGGPYSPLKSVTEYDIYPTYIDLVPPNGNIRLYFLVVNYLPEGVDVGKGTLGKAVKDAIADPSLGSSYKEVGNYWAVCVKDVVKAAKRVAGSSNTAQKRQFTSRGIDQKLQLEFYYMEALAKNVKPLCQILQEITDLDYSKS
jgi:8-oxo-dGTP pyrophosphatase MutT (NUDIX family)